MFYYDWKPYVPVAERRRQAAKKMESLRKKGVNVQPVVIEGRKITKTFWGDAWCRHLESFHDYENRLPRGRTYVRNGSVCHLNVAQGKIEAKVSGSSLYDVLIKIKTLAKPKWASVKQRCGGQIGSLVELLRGRLSDNVMQVVTHREDGLFPLPGEISLECSCPDWAVMCKHVAAVLYGVGARLDERPELLFLLRGVDHEELIAEDAKAAIAAAVTKGKSRRLAADNLSNVFGVDIVGDNGNGSDAAPSEPPKKKAAKKTTAKTTTASRAEKKSPKKKVTKKKAAKKAVKKSPRKSAAKKKTPKAGKKATAKQPVARATKTVKTTKTTKGTKNTKTAKKSGGKKTAKKKAG